MEKKTALLTISNLSISLHETEIREKRLTHNISFSVEKGRVISLVGESGCGKTLTAKAIMQLFSSPSLYISEGSILWKGKDLVKASKEEMRMIRGYEIAYIPQAPMSAFNPMMLIGAQLIECYRKGPQKKGQEVAENLLYECGFKDPKYIMKLYPHQLSGGMKQRVVIAMALMNTPDLLIADEPTTALDVSIQAEVLELLIRCVHHEKCSLLFITHDLGVVARISDRVIIMKSGEIVEEQEVFSLFANPQDVYTQMLIESTTI